MSQMRKERNANLKKVIVDYKKLNNTILDLLVNKYPDGYDDDDIITFRNARNEIIECVEVRTQDTLYLVKVSKRLVNAMENHDDEDDQENGTELSGPEFK